MLKKIIIKTDEIIFKTEKKIVIFSVLLMLFLSFFQVILRVFFHSGLSWLDIFLRYLVMISAFFSASIVSYYSKHFKIEIFQKLTRSNRGKKIFDFISSSIMLIAVIIIFINSVKFIPVEFEIENLLTDFKTLRLNPHHMILFIPVTFFNMLFHSFALFLKENR